MESEWFIMWHRSTGRLTTKYLFTLFHQNIIAYAYRTTTMQLMIRGFGFTDAKRMVRISGFLDVIEKCGGDWYHNMDERDCADWVEYEMNKTKRITVDWTGIIFDGG